jgi:hypothetical protein
VLAKNFDLQHFLVEAITEVIAEVPKKLNTVAKNGQNMACCYAWQVRKIVFLTLFSASQWQSAPPRAAW